MKIITIVCYDSGLAKVTTADAHFELSREINATELSIDFSNCTHPEYFKWLDLGDFRYPLGTAEIVTHPLCLNDTALSGVLPCTPWMSPTELDLTSIIPYKMDTKIFIKPVHSAGMSGAVADPDVLQEAIEILQVAQSFRLTTLEAGKLEHSALVLADDEADSTKDTPVASDLKTQQYISEHDGDAAAHPDIQTKISVDIEAHNVSAPAHATEMAKKTNLAGGNTVTGTQTFNNGIYTVRVNNDGVEIFASGVLMCKINKDGFYKKSTLAGTGNMLASGTDVAGFVSDHNGTIAESFAHPYILKLYSILKGRMDGFSGRGNSYGEVGYLTVALEAMSAGDRDLAIENGIKETDGQEDYVHTSGDLAYDTGTGAGANSHEWEWNGTHWIDNGATVAGYASDLIFGIIKGGTAHANGTKYTEVIDGLVHNILADRTFGIYDETTGLVHYTYEDIHALVDSVADHENRIGVLEPKVHALEDEMDVEQASSIDHENRIGIAEAGIVTLAENQAVITLVNANELYSRHKPYGELTRDIPMTNDAHKTANFNRLKIKGLTIKNRVKNANAINTAYYTASNGTLTATANVFSFLATAQNGYFRQAITLVSGHLYHIHAKISVASNAVSFFINDGITNFATVSHSANAGYETLSVIGTAGASGLFYFTFKDARASGWTAVLVKDIIVTDLTEENAHSSGVNWHDLSAAQISSYYNSYPSATLPVGPTAATPSTAAGNAAWIAFAEAHGLTTITLTNLIQNGQFTGNATGWAAGTGWAYNNNSMYYDDTVDYAELGQNFATPDNTDVYCSFNVITTSGLKLHLTSYGSGAFNPGMDLGVLSSGFKSYSFKTVTENGLVFFGKTAGSTGNVDNVSFFLLDDYTKAQIDANLAVYGYMPYNTAIEMVDVTCEGYAAVYQEYIASNGAWTAFAQAHGVNIMTLTQLIQNGQFTSNVLLWSTNNSSALSWDNNGYLIDTGNGSVSYPFFEQNTNQNLNGSNIYSSLRFKTLDSPNTVRLVYYWGSTAEIVMISNPLNNVWTTFSYIQTVGNGAFIQAVRHYYTSSVLSNNSQLIVDDISAFNSSTYTKTQIDANLALYGYLAYNTPTSFVDVTDENYLVVYDAYFGTHYSTHGLIHSVPSAVTRFDGVATISTDISAILVSPSLPDGKHDEFETWVEDDPINARFQLRICEKIRRTENIRFNDSTGWTLNAPGDFSIDLTVIAEGIIVLPADDDTVANATSSLLDFQIDNYNNHVNSATAGVSIDSTGVLHLTLPVGIDTLDLLTHYFVTNLFEILIEIVPETDTIAFPYISQVGNEMTVNVTSSSELNVGDWEVAYCIDQNKRAFTTAERPQNAVEGQVIFDSTLGKMIVFDGLAWINLDGSALE